MYMRKLSFSLFWKLSEVESEKSGKIYKDDKKRFIFYHSNQIQIYKNEINKMGYHFEKQTFRKEQLSYFSAKHC